ncbi:MAG: BON domain-containing protein [Verrucomicrobiota bacterium]
MKPKSFLRQSSPWIASVVITLSSLSSAHATPSALPTGDQEIAAFVELEVNLDQQAEGAGIKVRMDEGVAILKGRALSLAQAERAARRAMSTVGVDSVVNAVAIQSHPAAQMLGEIENSLKKQRMVDTAEVSFSLNGSRVTLKGSVNSSTDRELVRSLVAGVAGVSSIGNELEVTGDAPLKDFQIAEQLRFLIRNDTAFQGLDIAVSVSSGSVALRGEIGSSDEMGRLMRLCRVDGVSGFRTSGLSINADLAMEAFEDKEYGTSEALRSLALAFRKDERIRPESIAVKMQDRTLTLSGMVEHRTASDAAEANARAIPGIAEVVNRLVVEPASHPEVQAASAPLVLPPQKARGLSVRSGR